MKAIETALAGVVLALAGTAASAANFTEQEPNDSWASPQYLATSDSSIRIDAARTFADPSDDFFSFDVRGSGLLSIVSSSADGGADSILGLFSPSGTLLASNDDAAGSGAMSALQYFVAPGQTGRFTVGFSGFNPALLSCTAPATACYDSSGDFVFDTFVAGGGAGGSTGWSYGLNIGGVALVPEPGAWALFALGLPCLLAARLGARRRRHGAAAS